MEIIKAGLIKAGELTETLLNALSLLFIIIGVIDGIRRSLSAIRQDSARHPLHTGLRMALGGWLLVALEFQLAADIVGTILSATNAHLLQLGAIALIRTFLNFFLAKELKEERERTFTSERQ